MDLNQVNKKEGIPTSTTERLINFKQWIKNHTNQILIGSFLTICSFLIFQHYVLGLTDWADWTGFGEYSGNISKDDRGKTLWDWMELLIIPIVLAIGALLFNKAERENDRKIAENRIISEREIATDRQREATLQSYIDKMTELLLNDDGGLRTSKANDEIRVVARTRTIATLRMLDSSRKGILLIFLYEANLLSKNNPIVNLEGTDLSGAVLLFSNLEGANLKSVNLVGANLVEANLSEANLFGAKLKRANLIGANLVKANLSEANLVGAYLVGANLKRVNLVEADLAWVNLSEANLMGADLKSANLMGVNLTGANLTNAFSSGVDFKLVNLKNTIMPDGRIFKSENLKDYDTVFD